MSDADIQVEINKYIRMHSLPEMVFPNKEGSYEDFHDVSDAVWDELLACYDIDNIDDLDIPEKKKLVDDLRDKGVISQTDRDRFANMLNRQEEKSTNSSYFSEDPNRNEMYSNSSGVLEGQVHKTIFGSGMSETAKDNILAGFDFNQVMNQMKEYARCNRK